MAGKSRERADRCAATVPVSPRLRGPVRAATEPWAARLSNAPRMRGSRAGRAVLSRETGRAEEVLRHVSERHEVVARHGGRGVVEHAVLLIEGQGVTPIARAIRAPIRQASSGSSPGPGVTATVVPGRRSTPVAGSLNVCRGWNESVRQPRSAHAASTFVEVAPLVCMTVTRESRSATNRRGVQGLGEFARAAFERGIRDTEHVEVNAGRMRPHELRRVREPRVSKDNVRRARRPRRCDR